MVAALSSRSALMIAKRDDFCYWLLENPLQHVRSAIAGTDHCRWDAIGRLGEQWASRRGGAHQEASSFHLVDLFLVSRAVNCRRSRLPASAPAPVQHHMEVGGVLLQNRWARAIEAAVRRRGKRSIVRSVEVGCGTLTFICGPG